MGERSDSKSLCLIGGDIVMIIGTMLVTIAFTDRHRSLFKQWCDAIAKPGGKARSVGKGTSS
jgi:hypothetical protein